jgi:hypothetical protein
MIICNFDKVDVQGIEPLILTELTLLMRTIKDYIEAKHGKEYADNKIHSCIKKVFATEEELQEESRRILGQAKDPELLEDITETIIGVLERHYEEDVCRKD